MISPHSVVGTEMASESTGDSTCGVTVCRERLKDLELDSEIGNQVSTRMVRT